jgi:hypothetical protein
MGQLALGLRSLLVKIAIFVVMAALLAWALGGTLWPRTEVVRLTPVAFAGRQWFWQLAVGGRERGQMRYRLMVAAASAGGRAAPVDDRWWADVAGPVVGGDGLYYAGLAAPDVTGTWSLERIVGSVSAMVLAAPDRLAVEQQLARVARGLAIQDRSTIDRQRPLLLDPPEAGGDT